MEIFDFKSFDSAKSFSRQYEQVEIMFNGLRNMASLYPENVGHDGKNDVVIFHHTKVTNLLHADFLMLMISLSRKTAVFLWDTWPSVKGKGKRPKTKDSQSTTTSGIRAKVTSFYNTNDDVRGYTALIPVSGPKTREHIAHKGVHSCVLVLWKGKSGKFLARQFDPNEKNAVGMMTASIQIIEMLGMESDIIPVMHGKNVYKEGEEGHCFPFAYEFIAKSLDGIVKPRKLKPAHVYDYKKRTWEPVI